MITRIAATNGEHIKIKGGYRCLCGNTPLADGFLPSSPDGDLVEPTAENWLREVYLCGRCGRIIDGDTGAVLGIRKQ